ncbi:carboxylesterase family protein [Mucilaginibacter achroorhodeus]|uniref:Carboxylic ester hydrolase n=1 Tax=Mucilaginibacter achroorhodeus TaxID=2599294 RepID=A0A563U6B0_9SPHI|nr:carboxylesterase family protein [Mucilaginibacter achroorhodeus]TWR26878.1 carboxylesterase family protein [Mucilaginibacter achroorhodeus]
MKKLLYLLLLQSACLGAYAQMQVKTVNGTVEGVTEKSGVSSFKGIPFAQPPIGELRWKEPQPVNNWTGVRKCDAFGYNGMQKKVFGDMGFRSAGMSEDCLYLNVWVPAGKPKAKLPVLVYFYGGGFVAGDGSEARYDGESMAKRGIIALTVNYRLGVFGFLAHPELTKESKHNASGNYGLLDQNAALRWVQANIAAFGGDPKRVTIAGESAGSISVSAQMVSSLSKDLINGAIGESGAMIAPTLPGVPLKVAEENGVKFMGQVGAKSLSDLRAIPADQLLEMASKPGVQNVVAAAIDGYFFTKKPIETLEAGEQAKVPLLVGWNNAEIPYQALMWGEAPTPENYAKKVKSLYGEKADEVLKLYPGNTQKEVIKSATELASDRFISYSTWKWADAHAETGGKPVYRYLFSKPRPPMTAAMGNAKQGLAGGIIKDEGKKPEAPKQPAPYNGAAHASEIEYAMGNLATNKTYAWTPEDYKVSETMESYFANFIKTGNPNGKGLPKWNANIKGSPASFIDINVIAKPVKESAQEKARYTFLDKEYTK